MSKTKNYYQILEIPTNASVQVIKRAIRDLRLQDHDNDFSIVISNIEHVLTDAEQRENYDKSINLDLKDCVDYSRMHQFIPLDNQNRNEKFKSFFDFSNEDKAGTERVLTENLRHSPYNRTRDDILRENAQLEFGYAMSRGTIIWLTIAAILLFAGAVAFKPLRIQYLSHEQAREAVTVLSKTREGIEQYIKMEKIFPSILPAYLNPPTDAFYTLDINKDKQIVLTFNNNAAEPLRLHYLIFHAQNTPNIGLTWYCSPSDNFPTRYLPGACKTFAK